MDSSNMIAHKGDNAANTKQPMVQLYQILPRPTWSFLLGRHY